MILNSYRNNASGVKNVIVCILLHHSHECLELKFIYFFLKRGCRPFSFCSIISNRYQDAMQCNCIRIRVYHIYICNIHTLWVCYALCNTTAHADIRQLQESINKWRSAARLCCDMFPITRQINGLCNSQRLNERICVDSSNLCVSAFECNFAAI